ncbi:unnamed protein product [Cylicocyclus nassatus]|uniref:Uncharacterized protein n=1 Tax=Cylicocyclus nassatus TaxID=53992 RepID=A0AA36H3J9_CYLNA|nr:unnamed protein product [Cylicocyclus nassatus]
MSLITPLIRAFAYIAYCYWRRRSLVDARWPDSIPRKFSIILIFEIVITNSNVGQIRFHENPTPRKFSIVPIFEIVITNFNIGQIRLHERSNTRDQLFRKKKNFHHTHLRDFVFFDLNVAQI